ANSELLYPERSPQVDIYDVIVQDLVDAEQSGLPNTDSTGRISASAVKTLLSSVYLTMAGYPLQAGDQYYEMAAVKAKEIIENGGYSLFYDLHHLHHQTLEKSRGVSFPQQYSPGANIYKWPYPSFFPLCRARS